MEVSSFQGLLSIYTNEVFGENVLFMEVSSFQGLLSIYIHK